MFKHEHVGKAWAQSARTDIFRFQCRCVRMRSRKWRELTFMHWKVDAERLNRTFLMDWKSISFEGEAYVGVIPFIMKNVHHEDFPQFGISTFAEFNVRTYVVKDGQYDVFFLTLDAKSLVTSSCTSAYSLTYRYAKAKVKRNGEELQWRLALLQRWCRIARNIERERIVRRPTGFIGVSSCSNVTVCTPNTMVASSGLCVSSTMVFPRW